MARLAYTPILIALVATCASVQAQQQRGGSSAQIMSSIPGNSETITHWYKQNVYDPQDNKIGEVMDVLVDRALRGCGPHSRYRMASATSRFFSSPTFSRPVTWRPISATSKAARRSRCGDVAPSANSRSAAPFSSAPSAFSRSTPSPERLALAHTAGAETLDFMKEDVYDRIMELTHGRGADACIDAVGTEAEPRASADSMLDRAKTATFLGTDRPHVLRQAIHCCRNFGTVSIVGVYGGYLDKIPMGSAINRGLTFRMAQTPVQRYLRTLLERIENGDIDPSFVITHTAPLEKGPDLYQTFRDKKDGCIKVVLKPGMKESAHA
jgi:hypothetical protein